MIKPVLINKLYIGDYHYLSGIDFIKNTITIIFDCSAFDTTIKMNTLFEKYGITYIKSHTIDNDIFDIITEFKKISCNLKPEDIVLVCCDCAISRSITYSIMMLIYFYQYTLLDALLLLKNIQQKMSPNSGFIKQLITFELLVLGSNSINYRDYLKIHFTKPKS